MYINTSSLAWNFNMCHISIHVMTIRLSRFGMWQRPRPTRSPELHPGCSNCHWLMATRLFTVWRRLNWKASPSTRLLQVPKSEFRYSLPAYHHQSYRSIFLVKHKTEILQSTRLHCTSMVAGKNPYLLDRFLAAGDRNCQVSGWQSGRFDRQMGTEPKAGAFH